MLGLRTTIYKVSDLEKAKDWYIKAFKATPYFENKYYIGFNIKGYELGLLKEDTVTKKSDNILSYWGVEKIEYTYNYFLKLGATEHEKPNNVGDGILVASVKDPWHNVIGFIYNPNFKL